jgi:phenylacetate-coenzyme A ligase PaaK-like adenylate-forming protein
LADSANFSERLKSLYWKRKRNPLVHDIVLKMVKTEVETLSNRCCCQSSLLFSPSFSKDYYSRSLEVLEIALNQVPAYESWKATDPGKERNIDFRYFMMPILTKEDIRDRSPQGFVPRDRNVQQGLANKEIGLVETSGTINERVTNIWNQKWWDASERASWKLNSYARVIMTGNHREAILANPLNVGYISDSSPLPMEKRRLARFLYLNEKTNPLSWTKEHMDRVIKELEIFKPEVLEANPSLLAKLCRYITESGKSVFQPRLVVFTYESPTNLHYKQIRQVFDAPIASSYGSTEAGYVFMQCEHGEFHQNTEFCRVDFQPLKPEHGGPFLGRILVTTFNNPWYYIVRFDIGDLVRINESGSCPCGIGSGLILSAVEGRVNDVTLTCNGRLVTMRELDNALSVLEGVDEYQLRQETPTTYHLHLVTRRVDKRTLSREATEILSRLYGEKSEILISYEKAIAPEPSGKYRVSGALFPIKIDEFIDERIVHPKIEAKSKGNQ